MKTIEQGLGFRLSREFDAPPIAVFDAKKMPPTLASSPEAT